MIGPFCAKYSTFDPKKCNGAYFMTLKSHVKFEEKLTCGLENHMRNLANFYQNTRKCQNWYFKIDIRNLMNFDPRTQKSQKFTLLWAAFDQIIYIMLYIKLYI